MKKTNMTIMLLLLALAGGGCDEAVSGGGGGDSDTDTDADSDTDTDSDSDSDTDGDTDTGLPEACECEANIAVTAVDEQGGFCGPVVSLLAQSFVPLGTATTVGEVELYLCEQGADLPAHTVELRADVEGHPAANALASVELDAAQCTYPEFEAYCVDLGGVEVEPGTTYWLVLVFSGTFTETVFCEWATTEDDTYTDGFAAVGGPAGWNPVDEVISDPEHAYDFAFRVCDES